MKDILVRDFGGDMVEFGKACRKKIEDRGLVYTDNFKWVTKEDYEKYEFLQRDKGIPIIEDIVYAKEEVEEMEEDFYGNQKKVKKKKEVPKKIDKIHPDYIEWCAIVEARKVKSPKEIQIEECVEEYKKMFENNK